MLVGRTPLWNDLSGQTTVAVGVREHSPLLHLFMADSKRDSSEGGNQSAGRKVDTQSRDMKVSLFHS